MAEMVDNELIEEPGEFPDDAAIAAGEPPPLSVVLAPDHPKGLHAKIVDRLNARLNLSYQQISQRYDDMDQADEHYRMFIDLSRKAKKGDKTTISNKKEIPFERSIVMPVTAASIQVRLTQELALLSAREPMVQLQGRGPEDITPAKFAEVAFGYGLDKSLWLPALYSTLQDAEKYGFGVVYDHWDEDFGPVMEPPPPLPPQLEVLVAAGLMPPPQPRRVWGPVSEFNRWVPADPFNWWPDPRVPLSEIQNGEFCGHTTFHGYAWILERSEDRGGPLFNVKNLKASGGSGKLGHSGGGETRSRARTRWALDAFSLKQTTDERDKGFFQHDNISVKLIPKDWDLGDYARFDPDMPEIWDFTIVDEKTIIRAHAAPNEHRKFPYSVGEVNPDPHSLFNPGTAENLDGPQRFIDWLLNSHVENARMINNRMVYSPTLIEEVDFLSPSSGGGIRLTLEGEAMLLQNRLAIDQMYSQFKMQDMTSGHLATITFLFDMAQRMAAANDPVMGQPTQDKRTLGEVQQITAAASQRVATTTKLIDAQLIKTLVERGMANLQQFMSMEQFYRVTGDLAKLEETGGLERLLINRDRIQGGFDYVANTATMPPDPTRNAEVWARVYETVVSNPMLLQPTPEGKQINVHRIFEEMVKGLGVRNIQDFYVQLSILPDEQVAAGVQAGNFIPAEAVQ